MQTSIGAPQAVAIHLLYNHPKPLHKPLCTCAPSAIVGVQQPSTASTSSPSPPTLSLRFQCVAL